MYSSLYPQVVHTSVWLHFSHAYANIGLCRNCILTFVVFCKTISSQYRNIAYQAPPMMHPIQQFIGSQERDCIWGCRSLCGGDSSKPYDEGVKSEHVPHNMQRNAEMCLRRSSEQSRKRDVNTSLAFLPSAPRPHLPLFRRGLA